MSIEPDDEKIKKIFEVTDMEDSKKHFQPIILPKSFHEMEEYIKSNKKELVHVLIDGIEAAVDNNLKNIELFKFEKSGFIVVISNKEFLKNLENAMAQLNKKRDQVYITKINRLIDIITGRSKHVKKEKKDKSSPKKSTRKRKPKRDGDTGK